MGPCGPVSPFGPCGPCTPAGPVLGQLFVPIVERLSGENAHELASQVSVSIEFAWNIDPIDPPLKSAPPVTVTSPPNATIAFNCTDMPPVMVTPFSKAPLPAYTVTCPPPNVSGC